MGLEYYVALDKDIGISSDIFPTILIRFRGRGPDIDVQEIEKQLGLIPLTSMLSMSREDQLTWEKEYNYGEYKEYFQPQWIQVKPECWFEPTEGLRTIRGLLSYFQQNRHIAGREHFVEALQVTERVLIEAERQNVKFHFAVVVSGPQEG